MREQQVKEREKQFKEREQRLKEGEQKLKKEKDKLNNNKRKLKEIMEFNKIKSMFPEEIKKLLKKRIKRKKE